MMLIAGFIHHIDALNQSEWLARLTHTRLKTIWDLCSGILVSYGRIWKSSSCTSSNVILSVVSKAVLLIEYSVVFIVALITGSHGKLPLACYVFVNMLSIILWGASLAFGSDAQRAARFSLWYISIVIELIVNIAMKKNKQVSVAGSHLAERFGLFTLIILGMQPTSTILLFVLNDFLHFT
jgi:hypothetical protein